jgi:hypothetical protein
MGGGGGLEGEGWVLSEGRWLSGGGGVRWLLRMRGWLLRGEGGGY